MATAETRAAVPAIKTKEAEVRDESGLCVCKLFAGEAGEVFQLACTGTIAEDEGHIDCKERILEGWNVDKMIVPVARILTWLWLNSSLHTCGQYMAVDSKSSSQCSGCDNWESNGSFMCHTILPQQAC